METRKDKLTGEPVSLLGFGTMRLPFLNGEEDKIDIAEAERLIDYAYEHGVTYYDTAYPYHKGKSELFIGQALKKYPRESFYLADKMPPWQLHSKDDVKKIFEEQLEKCQVEYFDFYLCHNVNSESLKVFQEYDAIAALDGEKKAGRIKRLGFSFHDTPEFMEKEVLDLYDWDFAQIQMNYLDWDLQNARRQYELLKERNIPVIIMEPVRGGILATLGQKSAQILKEKKPDASIASWAIRFSASLPGVQTVLSGMSNMEQVADNISTVENFEALTEEEHQMMFHVAEVYQQDVTVPCTACRYCNECPQGVDIPGIFHAFNEYSVTKAQEAFKRIYSEIPAESRADKCVRCGMCETHCPQKITIPDQLEKISELAAGLVIA